MSPRRWIAALSLILIAVAETAPHNHAESIFDLVPESGGDVHVVRCSDPTSGVTHLDRDRIRHIDPCVACFRQHAQAAALATTSGVPQILQQRLVVTARVAHAHAIQLRKSSRGPPALAS